MKALVLVSGGLDSSTCLALTVKKYGAENVYALSVSYGQKHSKELTFAKKICEYYHVELTVIDLKPCFEFSDCSLLENSDEEIPKESYAKQLEKTNGTPVSTYVPFRNGLFLSAAASIGLSKGCGEIYYGAHADDSAGNAYPDCSEVFYNAMNTAIYEGSGKQIKLCAPFVNITKADVVKLGLDLNVPYEYTWSCYEGKDEPCGICGTCRDRANAFKANNVPDPYFEVRRKQNGQNR